MFGWFGNITITESSGGSSFAQVGNKSFMDSWETAPTSTTDWGKLAQGATQVIGVVSSIYKGINTANQYDEQYRSLSDKADTTKRNLWALQENFEKEKLMLDIDAYKTLGGIRARTGESGSGLDLLQESAMNYGIESWELGNAFSYQLNQMFRQYKAQRKAANSAKSGRVGSYVTQGLLTAGAIAAGIATGGAAGLALAGTILSSSDKASQVGGYMGSALR